MLRKHWGMVTEQGQEEVAAARKASPRGLNRALQQSGQHFTARVDGGSLGLDRGSLGGGEGQVNPAVGGAAGCPG